MNTITLPRADMETITECLRHLIQTEGWMLGPLLADINSQLDEQEY